MACRLPGGADSAAGLWRLLSDEVDAVGEVPAGRFDADALHDPTPGTPGRMSTRSGAFVEPIDRFDPGFFGISPREARCIDPAQRMLLEVAYDALEDAGVPLARAQAEPTGVFIGMMANEYDALMNRDLRALKVYSLNGGGRYAACGRVSFALGLGGPSLTVDTACSSSLVSVHLACQSIRAGESTLALAGGASVILGPEVSVALSQGNMLSPDGRCKFGDARADGFGRGEGVGLVVLTSLVDAIARGDRVYAVIRGGAVSSHGPHNPLMARPSAVSQEATLRAAYRAAGVLPGDVQYVEAHGTGTPAGDLAELTALGAVLGEGRRAGSPCLVGSIKTNIAHTEGASGVAGLMKLALSMYHRRIPRTLHFERPNPAIPWGALPLAIADRSLPWPDVGADRSAIGSVNSFGLAGTNAHLVLEHRPHWRPAPVPADRPAAVGVDAPVSPQVGLQDVGTCLVPLSARSPAALEALLATTGQWSDTVDSCTLADVAHTSGVRRSHHRFRAAATAASLGDLSAALKAAGPSIDVTGAAPLVVFVYPGQGSQWPGMGRQLLRSEPAFRAAIEACDAAIFSETGWSVVDVLTDPTPGRLERIDVVQPVLFSMEVALTALWRAWGVEPSAVIGHSMGEVAAAHVAGVLGLDDAARVICRRSRLLVPLAGRGAMLAVELSLDDAARVLAGHEDRVSVAVSNSPRSTVLSGDGAALAEIRASLEARGVFCRPVKVDVASHSPQMDEVGAALLDALADIEPSSPTIEWHSTVRAGAAVFGAAYWVDNLREPVRFAQAVLPLIGERPTLFVEIDPHPILLPAIETMLRGQGVALPSLRRDDDERACMLRSLGALYEHGIDPDWAAVQPAGRLAPLPGYQWQRERLWFEGSGAAPASDGAHPLLGAPLVSSVHPGTTFFETTLDVVQVPHLADHRVGGAVVLPGAAFVEMVFEAAAVVLGPGSVVMSAVVFEAPLSLAGGPAVVQTVVTGTDVRISSRQPASKTWTRHVTASIDRGARLSGVTARPPQDAQTIGAEAFYRSMADRGLEYGPGFRGVQRLEQSRSTVVAQIELEEARPGAVLDACLHAAAALSEGDGPVVPALVARVDLRRQLPRKVTSFVQASLPVRGSPPDRYVVDVQVFDRAGTQLAAVHGLELLTLPAPPRPDPLMVMRWREVPTPRRDSVAGRWLLIADAGGVADGLLSALREAGADAWIVHRGAAFASRSDGAFCADLGSVVSLRALLAATGPCDRIVDLHGLDAAAPPDAVPACAGVLHLLQALAGAAWRAPPRLWLVTSGAVATADGQDVAIAQAPLWGLARTITYEHPELRCTRLDLDPAGTGADVLLAAITASDGEEEVALRGGQRLVARIVRLPAEVPAAPVAIAGDRTYLITGGLGGLGLSLAAWLVSQGARHLALLGRTPVSRSAQRAAVDALVSAGATVEVVAVDVADRAAVERALEQVQHSLPKLGGVVHAAGVLDDGLLLGQSAERFAAVMAPKVAGAFNLHSLTADLDFFVLYGSAAGFLGSPGQGGYAAANAFVDALAHHRRAAGLPALAVDWAAFSGVGLAAAEGRGDRLAHLGLGQLTPDEGASILGRLLAGSSTQVAVLPLDVRQWIESHPQVASASLLVELKAESRARPATGGDLRAALEAAPPSARRDRLEALIVEHVAMVLRLPGDRVQRTTGLQSLGIDSLMGLELRNRLEAALDLELAATLIWSYPTVRALAGYLAGALGGADVSGGSDVGLTREVEVDALEDDEVEALLAAKLDAMQEGPG